VSAARQLRRRSRRAGLGSRHVCSVSPSLLVFAACRPAQTQAPVREAQALAVKGARRAGVGIVSPGPVCRHLHTPVHHSSRLACPCRSHSGGSAHIGAAVHLLRACSCSAHSGAASRPYCVRIPRPGLLLLFCHGLAGRVGPSESLFNFRVDRRQPEPRSGSSVLRVRSALTRSSVLGNGRSYEAR
jgi:hypothetical protein